MIIKGRYCANNALYDLLLNVSNAGKELGNLPLNTKTWVKNTITYPCYRDVYPKLGFVTHISFNANNRRLTKE